MWHFNRKKIHDSWSIYLERKFPQKNRKNILDGFFLQYRIGKGKSNDEFISNIYHKDCRTKLNPDDHSVVVSSKKIKKRVGYDDYDEGIVSLDFDKTEMVKSPLWKYTSHNSGVLIFCVRSELLLITNEISNLSVSFVNANVYLQVTNLKKMYGKRPIVKTNFWEEGTAFQEITDEFAEISQTFVESEALIYTNLAKDVSKGITAILLLFITTWILFKVKNKSGEQTAKFKSEKSKLKSKEYLSEGKACGIMQTNINLPVLEQKNVSNSAA